MTARCRCVLWKDGQPCCRERSPAPARDENLYGLITFTHDPAMVVPQGGPGPGVHTPAFNEDSERVAFCDWYRNTFSTPAMSPLGGWVGAHVVFAWAAWLARARA